MKKKIVATLLTTVMAVMGIAGSSVCVFAETSDAADASETTDDAADTSETTGDAMYDGKVLLGQASWIGYAPLYLQTKKVSLMIMVRMWMSSSLNPKQIQNQHWQPEEFRECQQP